ncbi:MAG: Beta-galactosidase [Lentisphaerae bacterium ADurb.BinA184]|nr:MAG: Beta-galactosidase [Lentisphaerae bacterium ADurb.BinA184]
MAILIDGNDIIGRQLAERAPERVSFGDGGFTLIAPARTVPMPDDEAFRICLDGEWRVRRWPFDVAEEQLAAARIRDGAWEAVQQPGKVFYADPEAERETIPNWNRVTQTHIHDEDGAVLRRHVAVPAKWAGRRILLRFDAVFPAGRVYVNGHLLGEHLSGLTPVEYDVTDKVVPGQDALIAVRLLRKHKYLRMDMVRHGGEFGGLAQSAFLFATGACRVQDYHLVSEVDASLSRGTVRGSVRVRNLDTVPRIGAVEVTVADAAGKAIARSASRFVLIAGETRELPVELAVARPLLWNDEYPNLYTVAIAVQVKGQSTLHYAYRTGFRRLDLGPEGPRLNGRFIKFRGVNHLTFHPDHGLYTPREWLRRNLALMKKANVNTIRTHYLGPRCLAELCSEMGLYLVQELPIDWGTNYIHDPEWVGPALMRIEGGIRRDRHQPSVMVWAVGNENMPESQAVEAAGWNHLRIFHQLCKRLDPSRPTMFPPPGPANKITGIFELRVGDIADTHYSFNLAKEFLRTGRVKNPRSWEADFEEMTREEALQRGWSGVWFSSEYGIHNMHPDLLNAPYNSIIDDVREDIYSGKNSLQVAQDRLAREWGFMRAEPTCLGGAFFPWLCAGAGKGPEGNPWGWVRWCEDADWGPVTADLLPKPFFWALRNAFSPVQFPARVGWRPGADAIEFEIQNQYNAIDLKDCTLRVQLNGASPYMGMCRRFFDVPMACPPGERVTVRIPVADAGLRAALDDGKAALARCTLLDPSGFRPIAADVLVTAAQAASVEKEMPIGPDAVL